MNTLRIAATAMLSLAALIGAVIVVAAADRDPCTRLPLDMTAAAHEAECAVAARDWRPDARLTSDPHRSLLTLNFGHAIAVDALGGVHVVWSDDRNGVFRVFLQAVGRRWRDMGSGHVALVRLGAGRAPDDRGVRAHGSMLHGTKCGKRAPTRALPAFTRPRSQLWRRHAAHARQQRIGACVDSCRRPQRARRLGRQSRRARRGLHAAFVR